MPDKFYQFASQKSLLDRSILAKHIDIDYHLIITVDQKLPKGFGAISESQTLSCLVLFTPTGNLFVEKFNEKLEDIAEELKEIQLSEIDEDFRKFIDECKSNLIDYALLTSIYFANLSKVKYLEESLSESEKKRRKRELADVKKKLKSAEELSVVCRKPIETAFVECLSQRYEVVEREQILFPKLEGVF
jgi:hypothetical protein